jgi:hypothetical protein
MPKSTPRSTPKHTTDEDLELLGELGVDLAPESSGQRSAKEERIIAGFEEIERFVEEQADCLSMEKNMIFLSGFMPCGSIAYGSQRNVVLFWNH